MSWSFGGNVAAGDDVRAVLSLARDSLSDMNSDAPVERDQQIDAAIAAVAELIPAVGGAARVYLSGHANPGHKDREGYSPETITVNLVAVAPAAE